MPLANAARRPSRYPWAWGVSFGLVVGSGVLAVTTLRYGFHASNVVLGLIVFIVFGLLGLVGGVARRYSPGGPV